METAEVLTDAEQCLTQARALVNAVRQLASRWEAAGDRAHAAELLSVASTAMSGVAAGDARHEIEGMAAVPDTAEPWAARLAGPHPPHISRVAGALLTWTSSRSQAYMVAYTLADAGLLAGDSPTQMLREFSAATGGDDRPYAEWAKLRLDLLREEVAEFVEALESGDVAAIAREGADVEYVVHGTMVRLGVDLDAAFREVHRANMNKAGPDGMFLIREDGKILKPDGFTPPDMSCAVADAAESHA